MKKGKRVLGLIGVMIIMVSIISVSAGFWGDLFTFGEAGEDLEGELADTFDTTVTLGNSPPSIVAILPIDDYTSASAPRAGSIGGQVDLVSGEEGLDGLTYVNVRFIVEDPDYSDDGATELPDDPPVLSTGIPTGTNSEVYVKLISPQSASSVRCGGVGCRERYAGVGTGSPAGTPSAISKNCEVTTCMGDSECESGGIPYYGTILEDQVKYSCYVEMEFYDEQAITTSPSTALDVWTMELYVEDSSGNIPMIRAGGNYTSEDFDDINNSGFDWDDDSNNYVYVRETKAIDTTESLAWSSLSGTSSNNPADSDLTLRNRGNIDILTIDLIPQNLTGTTTSTRVLKANAFSMDDVSGIQDTDIGACDIPAIIDGGPGPGFATQLGGNETVDDYSFNIGYNADGADTANLFFCIWPGVSVAGACEGEDCFYGAGIDNTFSASGCSGACDEDGESWVLVV